VIDFKLRRVGSRKLLAERQCDLLSSRQLRIRESCKGSLEPRRRTRGVDVSGSNVLKIKGTVRL